MPLTDEIKKVQDILKIPVNHLEFNGPNRVKIFSTGEYIGEIPYYKVANIYHYHATQDNLNWLEWYKVFNNVNELNKLIRQDIGRDDIICQSQNFGQVRVSEFKENILGSQLFVYKCSFDGLNWAINKL